MAEKFRFMVINGANLNFLGIREPDIYGGSDYKDLEKYLFDLAENYKIDIELFQSNVEGELVSAVQRAYKKKMNGIIINAGAYSHYSYALYDAILSVSLPVIEVHISNIYSRKEEFRKKCVIAPACIGVISGFGFESYKMAVEYMVNYVAKDV